MAAIDRLAFRSAALVLLAISPAVASSVASVEDTIPPGVEFAGRPHQNPKAVGNVITATGEARVPEGCKIVEVVVNLRKEGAGPGGAYPAMKATIDLTKSPATWSAKFDRVEPGVYWLDARVEYLTPKRQRMTIDSLERRRVQVLK